MGANKQKMIYILVLQYSTRDTILWTCAHRRNNRPFCTCIVFEYNFSYFYIIYLFYASGTHLYNHNYNHVRGRGGEKAGNPYFSSVSQELKIWGLCSNRQTIVRLLFSAKREARYTLIFFVLSAIVSQIRINKRGLQQKNDIPFTQRPFFLLFGLHF